MAWPRGRRRVGRHGDHTLQGEHRLLLTTCYWLLATYYWLLATCYFYWLLATYYLLLATCYLLLTYYYAVLPLKGV